VIVDMEAIVRTYLDTVVIGASVAGETPRNTSQAWVKVTQIGTRVIGNADVDHFHAYHIQLDCYASEGGPAGQVEAFDLYQDVRAALVNLPGTTVAAHISTVRFTAALRLPDEAFEPPRQRYILDAHIYAGAYDGVPS